jgi:hypothetical protein
LCRYEAGNCKEDIHAREPAAENDRAVVKENNRQDHNGPKSIDVVSMFQNYATTFRGTHG